MTSKFKKTYFARAFLRRPGGSNQPNIGWASVGMGFFCGTMLMSIPYWFFAGQSLYFKSLFWIFIIASFAGVITSFRFGMKYVQGLEGEKLVHDELEPIIRDGYHIINAFPGDKFDIDFVVVGPAGVYAIEVKNPSKFAAEDWIVYESGALYIKSKKAGRSIPLRAKDPIKQARRGGEWLTRYLSDVLGRRVQCVRSVVLFPRFLVEDHIEPDLMVLNPKRFVYEHLPKAPQSLASHEIGNIVTALRARIKTVDDAETADA